MSDATFTLDGDDVPFTEGQTILQAALAARRYVPYLCFHKDFKPHGSCKVCTVKVNGHHAAGCTTPARAGDVVESQTEELTELRRDLVQFLFTEGNHFCPSCEKSGGCRLQATAYALGMEDSRFPHQFPIRPRDFSHPDVYLDRDRCIRCELCVRASRTLDGKDVFAITGRGIQWTLAVNSPSGLLVDSAIAAGDHAVRLCPTGALMPKRVGFVAPPGERPFEREPLADKDIREFRARQAEATKKTGGTP